MIKEPEIKKIESVSFKAPEFEYQKKSIGWYFSTILISLVLIGVGLWQNSFLFITFVVFAEITIISLGERRPAIWDFKIDEKGITLKKSKEESSQFLYKDFIDFGIRESGSKYKQLILKRKSNFNPYLEIHIRPEDETKIKEIISDFLPEKDYPYSALDSIAKLLGF